MKVNKNINKSMIALIALASCTIPAAYAQLSFDSVFPPSPFKHALSLCINVYGDLEGMQSAPAYQHQPLIMDALLGRLLRLNSYTRTMSVQPMHAEDKDYFLDITKKVSALFDAVVMSAEHKTLGQALLADIASVVEKNNLHPE